MVELEVSNRSSPCPLPYETSAARVPGTSRALVDPVPEPTAVPQFSAG